MNSLLKVTVEMHFWSERMYSIAGNLSTYKDTKYEPLELFSEAEEEVRGLLRGISAPDTRRGNRNISS